MLEPPLGPWTDAFPSSAKALKQAPFAAQWKKRPGIVRHGFTHFRLELALLAATTTEPVAGIWARPAEFKDHAFPTLTRKLVKHAMSALQGGSDQPASKSRVSSSGMLSIG